MIKNSNRHSTKGSIKSGTKNSSRSKKPYTPKPNVNGALKDFTDGAIDEGVPEELKTEAGNVATACSRIAARPRGGL